VVRDWKLGSFLHFFCAAGWGGREALLLVRARSTLRSKATDRSVRPTWSRQEWGRHCREGFCISLCDKSGAGGKRHFGEDEINIKVKGDGQECPSHMGAVCAVRVVAPSVGNCGPMDLGRWTAEGGYPHMFPIYGLAARLKSRPDTNLISSAGARLLRRGRIWKFSGGGRGLRWVGGWWRGWGGCTRCWWG
jgi:hypothetical protein